MKELVCKVNNIIDIIEELDCVVEIKKINEKIYSDKELMSLLNEYQTYPNEKLKDKIISNDLFQEYKEKEIDINILIMRINQKIKMINNERSCNQ